MLAPTHSVRVTMYLKEARVPAVLDFLFSHQVAGATAVHAYAGFGSHHHMHTSDLVDISVDLPVILQFVDAPEKLEKWFPQLAEVAKGGLLSTQEVLIYRPSSPKIPPA
jgi:PII-like signaling protein